MKIPHKLIDTKRVSIRWRFSLTSWGIGISFNTTKLSEYNNILFGLGIYLLPIYIGISIQSYKIDNLMDKELDKENRSKIMDDYMKASQELAKYEKTN